MITSIWKQRMATAVTALVSALILFSIFGPAHPVYAQASAPPPPPAGATPAPQALPVATPTVPPAPTRPPPPPLPPPAGATPEPAVPPLDVPPPPPPTVPAAPTARTATTPSSITVTGAGTASLPPDLARITGTAQTLADTSDAALNQNSQIAQAVIAAAEAAGVPTANIKASGPTLDRQTPVCSQTVICPPGETYLVRYQASNTITVTTTDLSSAGAVAQVLVDAGVTSLGSATAYNGTGITYTLQNPEQLRTMALQAAVSDAEQQAQAAVAVLGDSLGSVSSITETSTNAGPVPNSCTFCLPSGTALISAETAAPPTTPGQITATTSATVVFAITSP